MGGLGPTIAGLKIEPFKLGQQFCSLGKLVAVLGGNTWKLEIWILFLLLWNFLSLSYFFNKVQCCVKMCDAGQMESTEVARVMLDGTEPSASHLVRLPSTALAHYFNMMLAWVRTCNREWPCGVESYDYFPSALSMGWAQRAPLCIGDTRIRHHFAMI